MKDNIYKRMTQSSWARDWFSTICFTVFVAISIAMIALTTMLFVNLTGAIDNLMEEAKTPDFLQMHMGEISSEEIEKFANEQPGATDYQVLGFLNFDNSILSLDGQSLLDSTQDNGISVQGNGFDYMLDLDNELPKVQPGQVYVPVCYESVYQIKSGDIMKIGEEELRVAGFIRDSQMNSMMASSKRFLVCDEDYKRLKHLGSEEYLIEFRFDENVDSNSFKSAYENANLPMNGPTITGPLIKMMNTLSDGIMIFIILLISILVLIISLVCIRFMLITRIVSESGEVGMLKAIGISAKNIKKMFLTRYSILIFIGGLLGIALSYIMFGSLSAQMQKLYGVSESKIGKLLFALISAVVFEGIIFLVILRLLKRLNEMTAVKALTGNYGQQKKKSNKLCIAFVTAIAVFLMMIPSNLYSTLSSPKFVTYMGIGDAQVRMDLRTRDGNNQEFIKIEKMLSQDSDVKEYALYQTCSTPVTLNDGTTMNMLMEWGNHTLFPVSYSKGSAPQKDGELALSYLLSEELGLYPGDAIWVKKSETYEKCTISGIYSDITNGGKTVKLFADDISKTENVMWQIAYLTLKEKASYNNFADKYTAQGAEVVDILSRVRGTYGPTLMQVKTASILINMVAVVIIFFIIMLFVRMIIANERYQISIKKALGFKSANIRNTFWKSCLMYVIAGIIIGTICGCILGEGICGMALKSLGAVRFKFVINIGLVIINVALASLAAMAALYMGSNGIKKIEAIECSRGRE